MNFEPWTLSSRCLHFSQSLARLAADELRHAAVFGSFQSLGRTVENHLRLRRAQPRECGLLRPNKASAMPQIRSEQW